jgi:alkylation response protein AidB-like acyl-CoA dehydrogenase
MSIANFSISAPSPTVDELVTSANKIGALVRELAERTEADRQVSSEVIERMREAGLFRIMQPVEYGGYEYGFGWTVCAGS